MDFLMSSVLSSCHVSWDFIPEVKPSTQAGQIKEGTEYS